MKKIITLLLVSICALPTIASQDPDDGTLVPLTTSYVDPTSPLDPNPKAPVRPPIIYQDSHRLIFATSCDGSTLQLVDTNSNEVYSIVIPVGTIFLNLPISFNGTYELQIISGNWLFHGVIIL